MLRLNHHQAHRAYAAAFLRGARDALQPPLPAGTGHFVGIQALRALAAMLVVIVHADQMWHIRIDPLHALDFWQAGAAGVDIFFVISGFVMIVSSRHLARVPGGWRVFAWRRVVRIVPLYWIMTTLKIATVIALPALALRTVLDPYGIVASYLFLPMNPDDGNPGTVLPIGWTLNVEAGFYTLFAIALATGRDVLRVTLPCLALAAGLSLLATPGWPGVALYCDPIILEFAAGMFLARLALRGIVLPPPLAGAALLAGLVLILLVPPVLPRLLSWGVPAVLVVAGAVGLETRLRRSLPRVLLWLGDASYAIYLTHSFVLPAIGVVLRRLLPPGPASFAVSMALSCLLSAAVGLVVYALLERPMLNRLKPLVRNVSRAGAGGGAARQGPAD